ncbi:ribonuclease BN/unknown domain fusion protein [Anaerohalosphaera lusitana]|uniref:Uncharacterized protein n=1 Tax=Anaerohalosphaera lusitana TaxID=1936003 RepID=A0A1U9NP94_9BACT|nr:YihY/virulence factor BrkB family protein [Anaerohalosphaera lusitana]AQT69538.1 ribonuclease BN/unknown domain fusion protein [Anaerohalosphaera lusitana]
MNYTTPFKFAKIVITNFLEDEAIVRGAGLAFFTTLSLAPILTILLAIAGFISPQAQQELIESINDQVGPQVAKALEVVIKNASERQLAGKISVILSTGLLFFSATAVFVQLQKSINRIWGVRAQPQSRIWGWIRKRLMSLGMVLGIGTVILLSIVVSTVLTIILTGLTEIVDFAATLLVFVLLFALIFKFLPDVKISWKNVSVAAFSTAALFAIGRYALLYYFSHTTAGSAYGAAGSLFVLLLWVYYSSLIFFLGAEITHVYATGFGEEIEPADYAEYTKNHEDQKKRIRDALK